MKGNEAVQTWESSASCTEHCRGSLGPRTQFGSDFILQTTSAESHNWGIFGKRNLPLLWNPMIFKNMWSAFYLKLFSLFFSCQWGLSVSLSYHPAVFKRTYWIMGLISITRSEVRACLNPQVVASGRGQWGVLGGINSKHVFIFQDESQWLQHLHSTTY